MDSFKGAFDSLTGGDKNTQEQSQISNPEQKQTGSGAGFLGGLGDKLNSMAGGGRESEKNEDTLDKGIDFVQERFLGQGPQDNESAVEQAKDEQISDFIRDKYKSTTGDDLLSRTNTHSCKPRCSKTNSKCEKKLVSA